MGTHTPGPWTIDADDGDFIEIYGDGDTTSVCEIQWASAEDLALIAAAPELLSALRAAVDCGMVPVSSANEGGAFRHSEQVRIADQIRSAIAKAEGRS